MSGFRIETFSNGAGLIGPDEKVWHIAWIPRALQKRCDLYQKAYDLGRRHDTIEYGRKIEAKLDPRVKPQMHTDGH